MITEYKREREPEAKTPDTQKNTVLDSMAQETPACPTSLSTRELTGSSNGTVLMEGFC